MSGFAEEMRLPVYPLQADPVVIDLGVRTRLNCSWSMREGYFMVFDSVVRRVPFVGSRRDT